MHESISGAGFLCHHTPSHDTIDDVPCSSIRSRRLTGNRKDQRPLFNVGAKTGKMNNDDEILTTENLYAFVAGFPGQVYPFNEKPVSFCEGIYQIDGSKTRKLPTFI